MNDKLDSWIVRQKDKMCYKRNGTTKKLVKLKKQKLQKYLYLTFKQTNVRESANTRQNKTFVKLFNSVSSKPNYLIKMKKGFH